MRQVPRPSPRPRLEAGPLLRDEVVPLADLPGRRLLGRARLRHRQVQDHRGRREAGPVHVPERQGRRPPRHGGPARQCARGGEEAAGGGEEGQDSPAPAGRQRPREAGRGRAPAGRPRLLRPRDRQPPLAPRLRRRPGFAARPDARGEPAEPPRVAPLARPRHGRPPVRPPPRDPWPRPEPRLRPRQRLGIGGRGPGPPPLRRRRDPPPVPPATGRVDVGRDRRPAGPRRPQARRARTQVRGLRQQRAGAGRDDRQARRGVPDRRGRGALAEQRRQAQGHARRRRGPDRRPAPQGEGRPRPDRPRLPQRPVEAPGRRRGRGPLRAPRTPCRGAGRGLPPARAGPS